MSTIAFIGGGNMARSLIGGLLQKAGSEHTIHVAEPNAEQRDALQRDFSIAAFADNSAAVAAADVVVLAVKPDIVPAVCAELATVDLQQALIISIAAGIRSDQIARWLKQDAAIVRVMPNTPALVGFGANGLYANQRVSNDQKTLATSILETCGICEWVDTEDAINTVTALSGSGPAYFFLMVEAMEEAAIQNGLSAETARHLAIQTCLGAGNMLSRSKETPATLRQRVTSPNGTTQAALESFAASDFRKTVAKAMHAARERAVQLAAENDN